jgi:superoxide dismutase, Cu-Zn family
MRTCKALVVLLVLTGCGTSPTPGISAGTAQLKDGAGRAVGTASLSESQGRVAVVVEVAGLQPGPKALHIHQVGRCESPSFESAGQHFNPGGAQHGAANPRGPHAGDRPNITIDETGRGRLEVLVERFSIRAGPDSLFDADGSAIVIHAAPDDMNTDPSGNSGARIACGPLVTSGVARAS